MNRQAQAVGLFMDLESTHLTEAEAKRLLKPRVCGVILFARNYHSPEQLAALTREIKQQRPDVLIAVDQEGGRVQRFKDGFTRLPAMMKLSELYQQNQENGLVQAKSLGWLMAYELIEQGVDLSFAPVLDVECGSSNVIGDRSFAHEPQVVTELASAFCQGMQETGMVAVGKHFPGHGGIEADTHVQSAIDERDLQVLENKDLLPFKALIKNQQLRGIMPAHVRYPIIDSTQTAGFSRIWLQDILRNQLNFEGVIFSDDLSMQAAVEAGDCIARAQAAISAGCNALLLCNEPDENARVLSYLEGLSNNAHPLLDLSHWQPTFSVNEAKHLQAKQRLSSWF